jgi:type IV pilus assembly protein PilA
MKINKFKGFTLIELLVIVAIISILATLILVVSANKRDRAAIKSYLSNLQNIRTAMQVCFTGSVANNGNPGDPICSGSAKYPDLPKACGFENPNFRINDASAERWNFSIMEGTDFADCKGCIVSSCNADSCVLSSGCQ